MPLKTRPFDPAEYLDGPEAWAAYLEDALSDQDPNEFVHALGVVARARGMTEIAREAGLSRQALYKSLSVDGRPEFATVLRVLKVLGFALETKPTYGASDAPAEHPAALEA